MKSTTCSTAVMNFTQTFEQAVFENDDERVRFYTGLPTFEILMVTFNHVAPHVLRALNEFEQISKMYHDINEITT